MLLMLFWMIATSSESNRVFEAFVFIPSLRLLNLGTGVISFDPILWLVGVYGLLLASFVLVMRGHEVGLADLGLERYGTRRQWLIGGLGVVLGIGFGVVQWTFPLEELPIEPTLANAVVMAPVLGLLVGFVEELLFRGLLQRWLEEVLPATSAVLVASLLFGFMHSIRFSPADVVFAFAVSLLIGWLYVRTRNFWSIWAIHALINIMAFAVLPLLTGSSFGREVLLRGVMCGNHNGFVFDRRDL